MNLTKTLALGFGLLALTGCPGGDSDTMKDDTETTPSGYDASAAWDASGVTLTISNGTESSYDFGMAETGAGDAGWYDEDCLSTNPHGEPDYGYAICHGMTQTGGRLESVYDPEEVQAGATTLFTNSLSGGLTYVTFEPYPSSVCWSWGDDTSYYADAGFSCTKL